MTHYPSVPAAKYLTTLGLLSQNHPAELLIGFCCEHPKSQTTYNILRMAVDEQLHAFELLRALDSYISSHKVCQRGLIHPDDFEAFYDWVT